MRDERRTCRFEAPPPSDMNRFDISSSRSVRETQSCRRCVSLVIRAGKFVNNFHNDTPSSSYRINDLTAAAKFAVTRGF